ncbi:MAG: GspE/PulE family protein, partial [Gemmatimonadales bacterium]
VTDDFRPEYLNYYRLLPLEIAEGRLRVAASGDPPDTETLADLEATYGAPIELVPVPESELAEAIRRTFAAAESVVELVRDLDAQLGSSTDPGADLTDTRDLANQPPVIRYVNLLIREAHDSGASDIHLEATREGLRVRLRVDGVLGELPSPPNGLRAAVISRIKLLAELDIAQRMVPQDGRIRVRLESRELDLRVSTVPTLYGESVVLRLLDRGGRPVSLEELGMPQAILDEFRRLCSKSHGIILSTGPTGSGKTTTLYAALGLRHPTEEKVITLEDPVEYNLPGVTQVPVHTGSGVTFATALRSLLRQDPDVLMVGEMRDAETTAIAVQAAMTGHLVFSTLHTNDAISSLTRLADLGVESYMLAASIEGVLAQRLVRKICPDCRERYRPEPAAAAVLAGQPVPVGGSSSYLQRGRGCPGCRQTGYRGRTGIFELLPMTDALRQALLGAPDIMDLRRIAGEQGMTTLKQDGWSKAQAGITTVEEVLRVVGE